MQKLIIIYNAKSGFFNQSVDYLHKMFSPSTYACDLCTITHSNFGSRKDWSNFIEKSQICTVFKYCDQRSKEELQYECPSILLETSEDLKQVIAASEFKDLNLQDLIALLENRIN